MGKRKEGKKRLLVFSTFFLPKLGGVEVYNKELFGRLTTTYDIDLVCCNTNKAPLREEVKGINVYRLPSLSLLGSAMPNPFTYMKNIEKITRSQSYDLVITHTRFFVLSYLGARFAKRKKIKHLHIEHGGAPLAHTNPLTKSLATLFDTTLGTYIIRNAWKVACVSQKSQEFVKTFGRTSEYVLYNGVTTSTFKKAPKLASIETNREHSIGYVGRLVEAKGVQHLIRAFKQLNNPEVHLYIAGDGVYRSHLEALAGNAPNIHFLGFVDVQTIPAFLASCAYFVNPSYNEGLPTTVLEAAASGCCVIATDVGGTQEIIDDEKIGYLVAPRSDESVYVALKDALDHPQGSAKKAKNAQAKVISTFDWDSLAKSFVKKVKLS